MLAMQTRLKSQSHKKVKPLSALVLHNLLWNEIMNIVS